MAMELKYRYCYNNYEEKFTGNFKNVKREIYRRRSKIEYVCR